MKNICYQMSRKAWLALVMVLCLSFPALAQKITVSGTVVDPTGEPLIGASVLAQGTTVGVATDFDGNYRLEVDANGSIVVSYVGYNTQTIAVNGQTTINVTLQENTVMLQEVVAIGYGVVKKSDATGSVAMVKPDDIEAGLATSAQDLLVGAAPGVVVTTDGGNPTGGAAIRIRGGASLSASNDPLIVLDGVPLSDQGYGGVNPLTMISPDNIESMTVLKDASATAIYGSRASNGVIIVTTKKGQAGKPQVNFSANMHVNTVAKTWDVLNGDEFFRMVVTEIGTESALAQLGDANTDWQKEVLNTTISHDYSLSVGGTAGILPYRVSASYTNSNGILLTSRMDRTTVGVNLTPKFFDGKLAVSANVKGTYIKNRQADTGAVGTALSYNPTLPVYTDYAMATEGKTIFNGYTTLTDSQGKPMDNSPNNPVAMLKEINNTAEVLRSSGNLQIDYALHFLPELHLNLNLGYDVSKNNTESVMNQNSPQSWRGNYKDGAGTLYDHYELQRNTMLNFYANYRKEFDAIKSNLDAMVGYEWQQMDYQGNSLTTFNTLGYVSDWASIYQGGKYSLTEDPATEAHLGHSYNDAPRNYWRGRLNLISFFGRINYSFDDTYLLTFTLRDDGTSRFSKENRWGLFPALALGWKIINMPFMENAQDVMNDFKLRLGWGITGQQAVGGYYPYIPIYAQSSTAGNVNYPSPDGKDQAWINPLYPKAYNENIKWEETTTWNAGFDFGFLNNRITAAVDYYYRQSKDLLSEVDVPAGTATTNRLVQNFGSLENQGVEFNITARPIVKKDLTWTINYNVAYNQNKITKLNNDGTMVKVGGISGGTGNTVQAHMVGYPASSFLLYEQVYDANGMPIEGEYVDQNGDGTINGDDLRLRYSKDPKVTMTFGTTLNWKNWDFGVNMRANLGNYVYNNVMSTNTNVAGVFKNSNLSNLVNSDVYFQSEQYLSDYWLENGSFLRCDNITLGYTWSELCKNFSRLRLYGAVQNPFIITKYSGLDPEVASGVDNNVYPRSFTFTLGLVATF